MTELRGVLMGLWDQLGPYGWRCEARGGKDRCKYYWTGTEKDGSSDETRDDLTTTTCVENVSRSSPHRNRPVFDLPPFAPAADPRHSPTPQGRIAMARGDAVISGYPLRLHISVVRQVSESSMNRFPPRLSPQTAGSRRPYNCMRLRAVT